VDTGGQDISRYHDWEVIGAAPVSIGSKVWVGFNVTILKGVAIGEGVVLGASCVVTRSIDPWTKAAGNPCRIVGLLQRPDRVLSDDPAARSCS
jgi:acetyltransferase-like isoleucine patch superfamily enzyme